LKPSGTLVTSLLLTLAFIAFLLVKKETYFHKNPAPVILYQNVPPVGYKAFEVRLPNEKIIPGPAGQSVTWDFSKVDVPPVQPDTANYLKVVSLLSSPEGRAGSGLGMEGKMGNALVNLYFVLDSFLLADTIYVLPGNQMLRWLHPKPELKFPFSYSDTLVASNQKQGGPIHSDTVIYDGYGDLKTPFGNYKDVVRLHYLEANGEPNYEWWTVHPFFPLFCYSQSAGIKFYIPETVKK